jgi:hypothetical protein
MRPLGAVAPEHNRVGRHDPQTDHGAKITDGRKCLCEMQNAPIAIGLQVPNAVKLRARAPRLSVVDQMICLTHSSQHLKIWVWSRSTVSMAFSFRTVRSRKVQGSMWLQNVAGKGGFQSLRKARESLLHLGSDMTHPFLSDLRKLLTRMAFPPSRRLQTGTINGLAKVKGVVSHWDFRGKTWRAYLRRESQKR